MLREGIVSTIEAGTLAYDRHVVMLRPITVAAQRWICTSFHLYALAIKLTGRLDKLSYVMYIADIMRDYSTIRSNKAYMAGDTVKKPSHSGK